MKNSVIPLVIMKLQIKTIVKYHYILEQPTFNIFTILIADNDLNQLAIFHIADGSVKQYSHTEKKNIAVFFLKKELHGPEKLLLDIYQNK